MTDKLKSIQPDVDVILVSGDFIAHGYAVKMDAPKNHYAKLKEAIHNVFVNLVGTRFPNAVILPALGNNDIKFHYIAPRQDDEASDYYNYFSDFLFNEVPGNRNINRNQIDQTFK